MDHSTLPPSPYAVDYPFNPNRSLASDIVSLQSTGRRRKGRHAVKPPSQIVREFLLS